MEKKWKFKMDETWSFLYEPENLKRGPRMWNRVKYNYQNNLTDSIVYGGIYISPQHEVLPFKQMLTFLNENMLNVGLVNDETKSFFVIA